VKKRKAWHPISISVSFYGAASREMRAREHPQEKYNLAENAPHAQPYYQQFLFSRHYFKLTAAWSRVRNCVCGPPGSSRQISRLCFFAAGSLLSIYVKRLSLP
jgi:hypothetical protein